MTVLSHCSTLHQIHTCINMANMHSSVVWHLETCDHTDVHTDSKRAVQMQHLDNIIINNVELWNECTVFFGYVYFCSITFRCKICYNGTIDLGLDSRQIEVTQVPTDPLSFTSDTLQHHSQVTNHQTKFRTFIKRES